MISFDEATAADEILFAVLAASILAWMMLRLLRDPTDRGTWLITACVAAGAIEYVVGLASIPPVFDSFGGAGTAKLTQNLALMAFKFSLLCFFLYSAGQVHRLRNQTALFLLAAGVLTAIWFSIPVPFRGSDYSATVSPAFDVVTVRMFQLTAEVYIGYAMLVALRAAWRFARLAKPPLSHGLQVIAVALGGKVVAISERAVANMTAWAGHSIWDPIHQAVHLVLTISMALFLVGVAYPFVAGRLMALKCWWRHYHDYRRLGPLWTALNTAFPQAALHRVPQSRTKHLLSHHSMHRRYYRRAIECRDGLVQISPYLPRSEDDNPTPMQRAAQLRVALRAHADHHAPSGAVMLVAPPALPGFDADVAELVALSDALRDGNPRSTQQE